MRSFINYKQWAIALLKELIKGIGQGCYLSTNIECTCEIKSAVSLNKPPKKASMLLIQSALKSHYLFSDIKPEDFCDFWVNLKYFIVPVNEAVFTQGDKGKLFFIIESGKLEVIRNGVKKNIPQSGDNFGEMALLTDNPRRATIRTIEESCLWAVTRENFHQLIKTINERNFEINKDFISNLRIFINLPDEQLTQLTQATVQQEFIDGRRIICEGDEGVLLYILKAGEVLAKVKGEEKFRINEGEMFGEDCVLGENQLRNFSIYSVGKVKLLSLSRESIVQILGDNFKAILNKIRQKARF